VSYQLRRHRPPQRRQQRRPCAFPVAGRLANSDRTAWKLENKTRLF
jgi:hypothetical protein